MVAQGILPTVAGSLDLTPSAIQVGSQRFCDQETPFWGQTQVKLFGVYPLPWDLQASAMFQNLPGSVILASYVVTNAQVSPSLGRDLAGGARNATVNLISPGSLYEDRWSQLDVRLTRTFRVGKSSKSTFRQRISRRGYLTRENIDQALKAGKIRISRRLNFS